MSRGGSGSIASPGQQSRAHQHEEKTKLRVCDAVLDADDLVAPSDAASRDERGRRFPEQESCRACRQKRRTQSDGDEAKRVVCMRSCTDAECFNDDEEQKPV